MEESDAMFGDDQTSMKHKFNVPARLSHQERLGKMIFFDKRLSINENQSCAACHAPQTGWTGPTSFVNAHGSVYEGSIPGRFGNRKPPSSAYATQSPILYYEPADELFIGGNFWDGRATGEKLGNPAADQAQGPFLNPLEQALASAGDVIGKICDGRYANMFEKVCGPMACSPAYIDEAYDCAALAVAAYEASPEVNQFSSKYDAVAAGRARFTNQEKKGFNLFAGKAKCVLCHVLGEPGMPALFTDYTFDNLGVPGNPENPFYTQYEFNPLGPNWIDNGLGEFLASQTAHPEWVSLAGPNYGKHKVPTLRNVDLRPSPGFVKAFGHNGYFKSLKRIVHFYNTRDVLPACPGSMTDEQAETANCWPAAEVAQNVNTSELGDLGLTDAEEDAVVAFMKTLSDSWNPRKR
jgi:cytochrome c peroxidase